MDDEFSVASYRRLAAIELALTGRVVSLERADPNYKHQLLHRLEAIGAVSRPKTAPVGRALPADTGRQVEAAGRDQVQLRLDVRRARESASMRVWTLLAACMNRYRATQIERDVTIRYALVSRSPRPCRFR